MTPQERIGIEYKIERNRARGTVAHYHGKPQPRKLDKTPYPVDIAGLPPRKQASFKLTRNGERQAPYTIGVEVEKNEFHRAAVKEYPLFCGFERDGSCGMEAVTNVLPLLPAGSWRNKVYNMFYECEKIIDDRYSPSDGRCSAHVTVTVDGITNPSQLLTLLRPHAGIIMALYRHRLKNPYCSVNLTMIYNQVDTGDEPHNTTYNPGRGHMQFANTKQFFNPEDGEYRAAIEFRAPSRLQSVKQMMRRYEFWHEYIDFCVTNPGGSFTALMGKLRPIILNMYEGDEAKAQIVIDLAPHFNKFIKTGIVTKEIVDFVDPNQRNIDRWSNALRAANNLPRIPGRL